MSEVISLMVQRPCLRCGTPVQGRYCSACKPQERSWAWRKRSRHLRARQPFCARCGATEALQAHHLQPLHQGGPESGPVVILCSPCHHAVHAALGRLRPL